MEAPDQTDGERIAAELGQIRELLQAIASALFEIAAAGDDDKGQDSGESLERYLDGTPVK